MKIEFEAKFAIDQEIWLVDRYTDSVIKAKIKAIETTLRRYGKDEIIYHFDFPFRAESERYCFDDKEKADEFLKMILELPF